jgi:hypothetical protein
MIQPNSSHQQTAQRQAFSRGRSLRSWHLMQPSLRIANLDARWALTNGMVWSQFVRAAWVHEFRPDRSIRSSFVSVPGTLFPVDGARAWIERR